GRGNQLGCPGHPACSRRAATSLKPNCPSASVKKIDHTAPAGCRSWRGTVAAVPRMMNDTHVGQLLNEPVADLARAIFAAVVHHNDLKNWSNFRYSPICVR